jgi:hypothetical protein
MLVFLCNFAKWSPPPAVTAAYSVFLLVGFSLYHMMANGQFSAILTMSAVVQCLAISILAMQVVTSKSADGISAKALILDVIAFSTRLSSTIWKNGYLPADVTGDWVYQLIDICSLVLTLWLLHHILVPMRMTYNAEDDALPIGGLILGCMALAVMFHGDLDDSPVFDTLWTMGLYTCAIQVLPQLWLISKKGGQVHGLTSHYIATMALSRVMSGLFMWHAREDLTCTPWIKGYNHAPYAILGAHAVHLLLLGDFMYYYFKGVANKGLSCSVLPTIAV